MSRKKHDKETKTRLQVVASTEQGEILNKAAVDAGTDRSTWMLAHSLKAAKAQDASSAPIVIDGAIADRLRAEAGKQGIKLDQLLEQYLVTG
jgi:uncharacterized protein (DUF1778 family)